MIRIKKFTSNFILSFFFILLFILILKMEKLLEWKCGEGETEVRAEAAEVSMMKRNSIQWNVREWAWDDVAIVL